MNKHVSVLAAVLLVWLAKPAFATDVDSEVVFRVLGDAYVDDAVEDDTGQKLIAAAILLRQGNVENASSMYCRILTQRFRQFKRKHLKNQVRAGAAHKQT